MSLLSPLILYIVGRLREEGYAAYMTLLVKLLYLADVEHYRRSRTTLTEVPWRFHYYGPYSAVIEQEVQRLHLDLPETAVSGGRSRVRTFAIDWHVARDLDDLLDYPERALVDDIVRQWGGARLNQLLSYVYFDTEPMRAARPNDLLDFSTIPTMERVRVQPQPVEVPEETLKRLSQLLQLAVAQHRGMLRDSQQHKAVYGSSSDPAAAAAGSILQREAGRVPTGLTGYGPTWREAHGRREPDE